MIIGSAFSVKLNSNIGNSALSSGIEEEIEKSRVELLLGRRHTDGPLDRRQHTRDPRVDYATAQYLWGLYLSIRHLRK